MAGGRLLATGRTSSLTAVSKLPSPGASYFHGINMVLGDATVIVPRDDGRVWSASRTLRFLFRFFQLSGNISNQEFSCCIVQRNRPS